ncbi:MAG TPA: hypothetical protein VMZ91_03945 [Candidatus Paceibacterota bacterium]|nr:hypothetical protein [Candidatus Paceibacterota bacterium]
MAEITALFRFKEIPSKEIINEEHNWYDNIKQEMLVFKGGKLSFEYKEDEYLVKMGEVERTKRGIISTYRMMPKIEDLEVDNHFKMTEVTNKNNIEKWFDSYGNYTEASIERIEPRGIVFEVPENEVDDFYYQLERQGFDY